MTLTGHRFPSTTAVLPGAVNGHAFVGGGAVIGQEVAANEAARFRHHQAMAVNRRLSIFGQADGGARADQHGAFVEFERRGVMRHRLYVAAAGDKEITDVVKRRSEEHTSELQSLMRKSYAVFCLK